MKSKRIIYLVQFIFLIFVGSSNAKYDCQISDQEFVHKIAFDICKIAERGTLSGSHHEATIDYEFCIPAEDRYATEIQRIDATVAIHKESSGRIGCSEKQWLCIGNTHQENIREVLLKLARLPYINRKALLSTMSIQYFVSAGDAEKFKDAFKH